jgi:hypothetical protein
LGTSIVAIDGDPVGRAEKALGLAAAAPEATFNWNIP